MKKIWPNLTMKTSRQLEIETKICWKTMKTSKVSETRWNKLSFLLYISLILFINPVFVTAADMSFGEVKDTLDRVNSQPGNLDEINMPTKCESCQVFLRDFEVKAMEIPLKLVSPLPSYSFYNVYFLD
jgi:hypothetical protein